MIQVTHLTKTYGHVKAVDDISFRARSGEITILLGPNGAGKSTTIKSITNLLKYDGDITICGYDNHTIEAKSCFGYIPETPVLYDLLTIEEHVAFIAHAYRIKDYEALAEQYLSLFELKQQRKKTAKALSKGMKQKLSMLLALMIQPKALLVDEPMVGLDPSGIEETLHLLVQLKQEGLAILISTHIIDVISDIWDVAYIMNKGKIVKQVRRDELGDASLKELFFAATEEAL